MTAHDSITLAAPDVNSQLVDAASEGALALLSAVESMSPRQLEEAVWNVILPFGRALLEAGLMLKCWAITRRVIEGRLVELRLDDNYVLGQGTTFGHVHVPLFAFRDERRRTQAPAREQVFPLHPECRSSELLLEWETRLGSQLPFRQAEDAMEFFTHGAARTEDTTIARHVGVVGAMLDNTWTCRTPDDVAAILTERATCDRETGKPLMYASTDAHALRRYTDDTWTTEMKMINGIRLWCIDKRTGQTIHVGGEYTWGDCREVAERMAALLDAVVPTGESAPQIVMITDGMPWIRDHVYPVMPPDTVFILDFYHLALRLGEYAAARFGKGTKLAKAWIAKVRTSLMGKRGYRRRVANKRKGHRKKRARRRDTCRTVHLSEHPEGAGEALITELIEDDLHDDTDALWDLIEYVDKNTDRTDYPAYRSRGMQIGSGAMESLHRTASQMRLKLAGARWTPQRALAVLNTRLLLMADRWQAFWSQPNLSRTLRQAFRHVGDPTP